MPNFLSPELVLVLTDDQRAEAIRALPPAPVWQPGPLGPALRAARPAFRAIITAALVYFVVKLLWTLGTAALYVLIFVAVIVAVAALLL